MCTTNTLISVIVPVYNVETYLRQCIDSIIGQTYRDLEIILVNDGSTDGSGVICDEYASRDARIKVIHKANGGLSSARNAGLEVAVGDLISFVDSDDWVEITLYDSVINTFKGKPDLDIVRFNFYLARPGLEKEEERTLPQVSYVDEELIKAYALSPNLGTAVAWCSVYRASLLREHNLKFVEGILHEDEPFTLFLYSLPKIKLEFLHTPLYNYRLGRIGAITSKKTVRNLIDLSNSFQMVLRQISPLNPGVLPYMQHYVYVILEAAFRDILSQGGDYRLLLEEVNKYIKQTMSISPYTRSWEDKLLFAAMRMDFGLLLKVESIYAPIARRLGIGRRFQ